MIVSLAIHVEHFRKDARFGAMRRSNKISGNNRTLLVRIAERKKEMFK